MNETTIESLGDHRKALYRMALGLARDPHLAGDLVQDTFVRARQKIDQHRRGFDTVLDARHMNNWGISVTDEIIASTEAYLEAHPYADPAQQGYIGASYGGFMTMLLTMRTDMFAAAVSHAGISSISSYWGEGNWGFTDSAVATAMSYPWNRPDIYIDQSSLFAAEKVVTPLLLLHGAIDNNVPPGECEQKSTALRVLGKEVEYIVVWFGKHLKDDATWWGHLWPEDE